MSTGSNSSSTKAWRRTMWQRDRETERSDADVNAMQRVRSLPGLHRDEQPYVLLTLMVVEVIV